MKNVANIIALRGREEYMQNKNAELEVKMEAENNYKVYQLIIYI